MPLPLLHQPGPPLCRRKQTDVGTGASGSAGEACKAASEDSSKQGGASAACQMTSPSAPCPCTLLTNSKPSRLGQQADPPRALTLTPLSPLGFDTWFPNETAVQNQIPEHCASSNSFPNCGTRSTANLGRKQLSASGELVSTSLVEHVRQEPTVLERSYVVQT